MNFVDENVLRQLSSNMQKQYDEINLVGVPDVVNLDEDTSDAPTTFCSTDEAHINSPNKLPTIEKRKGGWPKGKKRRKESTEAKPPKAPTTGYVLFLTERRPLYKSTHPDVSFAEITKVIGNEWTNLRECEKQKYLDEAEADKRRYRQELQIYRQSGDTCSNGVETKTKADGLCDHEEIDRSIDDFQDNVSEHLFCEVCNVYFNNLHNKKEHLYGRQHLLAITDETRNRLSIRRTHSIGYDGSQSLNSTMSTNVPQALHELYEMNFDRETEIIILHEHLGTEKSRNAALLEEIRQLQILESSLGTCLEELSAEKMDLEEQLENLRMVPTLFGVINFHR